MTGAVLLSAEQGWGRVGPAAGTLCKPGRGHGGRGERMERPKVAGRARLCDGGSDHSPHPGACEDSRCGLKPGLPGDTPGTLPPRASLPKAGEQHTLRS